MHELSIKIKNYKCFNDECGFDEIRRVNLIIGRNNSGKSSLLDIIDAVTSKRYEFDKSTWRNNQRPQMIFESIISDEVVKRTFPQDTSGGVIGGNHGQYGLKYIGKRVTWTKQGDGKDGSTSSFVFCEDKDIKPSLKNSGGYANQLVSNIDVILEGKTFRRMLSDREIIPEISLDTNITIAPNGNGLTNTIQCFINKTSLPSSLVEKDILKGLNEIFAHDAEFTDIVCQLHDNNFWEIYLVPVQNSLKIQMLT